MKTLLRPQSIAEMVAHIEESYPAVDSPDGFKPPEGWHTIDVGGGYADPDPGTLGTWLRLFSLYAAERKGNLIWLDVPHFDREKRQVSATFCIAA